jgi:hypothetical protein
VPSPPPPLDRIAPALADDLAASLGSDLVGAYLYGSAVSGGFDPALSDLDVVVVTERSVDEIGFEVFAGIVDRLAAREPEWADRLDVTFVGRETLWTFRRGGGPFVEISHEQPLQVHRRAEDWLETWFLARDADRPIVGPPPASVFPPIDIDEFLQVLVDDVERYAAAIRDDWSHEKVAYRVLTLCRLLRSLESRAVCSKEEGAEWAAARYPDRAPLIRAAWDVRAARGQRPFTPAERAVMPGLLADLATEVRATIDG